MSKTNTGLVEYCKAQVGKPYWYGCFGQESSAALYKQKKAQYPSYYTADDFGKQYGKKVHDCIGLIKGYIWSDSNTDTTPSYAKGCPDINEVGMYEASKEKGAISSMPDIPGILVYKDGHIGVYIGGGYCIEARGHAYGVVKTKLADRNWLKWSKCPYIEYATESKPSTEQSANIKLYTGTLPTVAKNSSIKTGSTGAQVKNLQKFLNWYGNYKLEIDGKCGALTTAAIKKYQKAEGLTVDGHFGANSLAKAKALKAYDVIVNCSLLNVRSGSGAKYEVKKVIKKGDKNTIVETCNVWGKLKTGGGWVNLKFIKRV